MPASGDGRQCLLASQLSERRRGPAQQPAYLGVIGRLGRGERVLLRLIQICQLRLALQWWVGGWVGDGGWAMAGRRAAGPSSQFSARISLRRSSARPAGCTSAGGSGRPGQPLFLSSKRQQREPCELASRRGEGSTRVARRRRAGGARADGICLHPPTLLQAARCPASIPVPWRFEVTSLCKQISPCTPAAAHRGPGPTPARRQPGNAWCLEAGGGSGEQFQG